MPERGALTCFAGDVTALDLPDDRRTIDDLTIEVAASCFVLVDGNGDAFRFEPEPQPRLTVSTPGRPWEEAAMDVLLGVVPLTLPAFGLVPLHGAAVSFDGRTATLVLGDSGAGKSTTLHGLLGAGATFLSDDACAVDADGSLWPGPPLYTMRGVPSDDDLPTFGGKGVLRPPSAGSDPLPIGSVVVLEPGDAFGVEEPRGGDAVQVVMAQHRSKWLLAAGRASQRFGVTTHVASLPISKIRYRHGHDPSQRVVDAILDRCAGGP